MAKNDSTSAVVHRACIPPYRQAVARFLGSSNRKSRTLRLSWNSNPGSVPPSFSNLSLCSTRKMPEDAPRNFIYGKRPVEKSQHTLGAEGTLHGDSSHDSDSSLDGDESNGLCWTYDEGTTAVLHATGCPPCGDWKEHFQDDEDGSLPLARSDREFHIHRTLLQQKVDALSREQDECRQEVAVLRSELEAVRMEAEEIQKETERTQEAQKEERTQLAKQLRREVIKFRCELEEARSARHTAPSDASSHQPHNRSCELDGARHISPSGASSSQPSKRRRVDSASICVDSEDKN